MNAMRAPYGSIVVPLLALAFPGLSAAWTRVLGAFLEGWQLDFRLLGAELVAILQKKLI